MKSLDGLNRYLQRVYVIRHKKRWYRENSSFDEFSFLFKGGYDEDL